MEDMKVLRFKTFLLILVGAPPWSPEYGGGAAGGLGPIDGPCLNMPCPWIVLTGQSDSTWSNLEQLAHNNASWSETIARPSEPL